VSETIAAGFPAVARQDPERSARTYFEIEKRRPRLGSFFDAVYGGVWLGLLDDEQIAAIGQIYYAEQGPEWRSVGWTELGLKPWEDAVVTRYFDDRRRVIVGCAGAGREAFALARRGFDVVAFDCSPSMVGAAKWYAAGQGLKVSFVFSAPDRVPDFGAHDGAIVGWGGIMHVVGSERRVAFLRGFRDHMPPGAPLLVSFYVRKEHEFGLAAAAAIGSGLRRLRGRPSLELGDELRPRFYRHRFTRPEIEATLRQAGFALAEFSQADEYAVGIAV
jgi:hypothetical protein